MVVAKVILLIVITLGAFALSGFCEIAGERKN